jgi:hypothetical protein
VGIALIHGGKALVVQKKAFLKQGYTAEIVITDDDLASASEEAASQVVVKNQTSPAKNVLIVGLRISPTAGSGERSYSLPFVSSVVPDNVWSCYVVNSLQLPILQGSSYKARLTVLLDNTICEIENEFDLETLYSMDPYEIVREIILEDTDLPSEDFRPVTGMTINPQPYELRSDIEVFNGNFEFISGGKGIVNLNNIVTILPASATKQDPVEWTVVPGGAASYVSLTDDSVLKVTGIAQGNDNIVTVHALIREAGLGQADFTASFTFKLVYYLNGVEVEITWPEDGKGTPKIEYVFPGTETGTGDSGS